MRTLAELHLLTGEVQQWIRDYLSGRCTRSEMADWATRQLRSTSEQASPTEYDELIEYILCRFVDDDWTSDEEYRDEMQDLLARLQRADKGEVILP